jgi:multiple sugar transport system permease protein
MTTSYVTPVQRRATRTPRVPYRRAGYNLPVAIFLLFTLVPFYWMVVYAFRADGSTLPLPVPFTISHLATAWDELGFAQFLQNSVLVAICTFFFTVLLSLITGYALARYRFRGKQAVTLILLATQFVPGAMLLIPLFLVFKQLGLIDNLAALVIADTVFQLPLCAILMSNFIQNVPMELEESAWIDGCSRPRAFAAVVLPLLRPAIVATGSFAFIGAWNNFLFALMFINTQSRFTLPVGLNYAIGAYSVDYGALAAGGVIAALPVVIVFAVIQRFLVQGVSAGAVKG